MSEKLDLPPELVEGLLRLCAGDFSTRLARSYQRDASDVAAFFVNAIAEELARMVAAAQENEVRLGAAIERLTGALTRVAAGDFSVRVERDFKGDGVDVLAFLVNNTIVELERAFEAANRKAALDRERLEGLVAERTQELHRLATLDPVTGIFNRRRILEVADEEVARAARYGHPLSFAMVDVDHFKKVNDSHGHVVGDDVLRRVAEAVTRGLRRQDTLGRYGGEEFALVIPETALPEAVRVAERVRAAVASVVVTTGPSRIGVTVSIGVAQWRQGQTLDDLLRCADRALYDAKAQGRDRVVQG